MDQKELARFEAEAAETVGAMKDLFREFENRLGEVVSAQRVTAGEARAEGARITQQFQELARSARDLVVEQRKLLRSIEREWRLRIDDNARRAGEAHAQAFGESIAQGLHERFAELAAQVEASTRRLTWKTSLRWALGIGIAIPLSINLGIRTLSPGVEKSTGGFARAPEQLLGPLEPARLDRRLELTIGIAAGCSL